MAKELYLRKAKCDHSREVHGRGEGQGQSKRQGQGQGLFDRIKLVVEVVSVGCSHGEGCARPWWCDQSGYEGCCEGLALLPNSDNQ